MTRAESVPKIVRCAVYTRKSTDEGLEKDFNSLDAQRESGEAYIASQRHEGWECLPTEYDDGGFTGGNMDRPALKRLLADIQAGKIDCVVVYKVDRLSRSLLDFTRLLEVFDRHGVAFVSVTQSFSTNTSIGRLTLNMLLSFAQFEREVISERTRDKMAATRRKGKWAGGRPVLGYDIIDAKLVVNPVEAAQVRTIFELYLQRRALIPTVAELERRGWRTKRWIPRKGGDCGGLPFDKGNLHGLLTNVIYTGQVRYKAEIHAGEHAGIVDPQRFAQVQVLLKENARSREAEVKLRSSALLRGLLRCVACGRAMSHTHTKRGSRRYRYYVCGQAQKRGWTNCPTKSVPAPEIERFVIDQIRSIGRSSEPVAQMLAQAGGQVKLPIAELEAEQSRLQEKLIRYRTEIRALNGGDSQHADGSTARMAELQEWIRAAERRGSELDDQLRGLREHLINEDDLKLVLAAFDPNGERFSDRRQVHVLQRLVQRVEYDGRSKDIAITFQASGFRALADEMTRTDEATA